MVRSEGSGTTEQTAVDGVNDWLRRNGFTAEETTVQTLDGVLAP